jgi:hypothetical protein
VIAGSLLVLGLTALTARWLLQQERGLAAQAACAGPTTAA